MSKLLANTTDELDHDLRQSNSRFILPGKQNDYNHLSDKLDKNGHISGNRDDLLESTETFADLENRTGMFSFYDPDQQAIRDLSKESAKFLWFQLFNDVILRLPRDNDAKKEMIDAFRHDCQDNSNFLEQIEDFQQNYDKSNCIKWYTKDTFVYRLINKALRTEDIEALCTYRYYIADLSSQLEDEYQKMDKKSEKTIRLYRGMIMTKKETEILKANEGKLIATNGYWSTSPDPEIASSFVSGHVNNDRTMAVIFEIECDIQNDNDSGIFADITRRSKFPEEEEVLFDIGAVFEIEKISEEKRGNTDILVVQKKRSAKGREIVNKFIEENRKEMEDESPTIMFCTLLKRMGKFNKSLQLLRKLLDNPGDENIAHIQNRIGIALKDENQYKSALEHFQIAFDLTYFSQQPQRKYAAFVLHNKGLVYAKTNDFDEALNFYRRAISVLEKQIGPTNCGIAQFNSSIGRAYLHLRRYDEALKYQKKALEMRKQCLPPDHVVFAFSYADIGNIYSRKNDYNQALDYHNKALNLRKRYLPTNHHNIAWSLHQVGKIYYKKGDLDRARIYYLESLKITRKCQSVSLYNSTLWILEDIARTYDINSEQVLEYRLEALEIQRRIEPVDYSDVAYRLDQVAFIYKSMDNLNDSLKHYEEALNIRRNYLPNDRWNLACSFKNLATVYEKSGANKPALDYYEKALNACPNSYYHNDSDFYHKIRKNISRVKQLIQNN